MKQYKDFLTMLSSEFNKYLIEHHKTIPHNALVIFEVGGEEEFNHWHKAVSMKNREPKQPVVIVQLRKWRRHSAIDKVTLQKAAA